MSSLPILIAGFQFDWTITIGNLFTICSVVIGVASVYWKQKFFNEKQVEINTRLEAGIQESKNISTNNSQQILSLRESHIELKSDVKHTKDNVDEVKETVNHMSEKIDTIKSFRT